MNSLKSIVVAMVAGATFAVSLPVMAQYGSNGTVQDNVQNGVITGNGGRVTNSSSQNNTTVNNGRRTSGDNATIQRNVQNCDILGDNGECKNQSSQSNTQIRNNGTVRIRR